MKYHLPTISQFASLLVLNITNALFQLLLIPILIHNTDNDKLGVYFIVLSYSVLASILVNFGTSQTSVVEIRKAGNDEEKKYITAEVIALRTIPFVLAIVVSLVISIFSKNGIYFLLVTPIIFSEFINPQFYLIATYKINKYTLYNLFLRIGALVIVYYSRNSNNLIEIALITIGIMMTLQHIMYLPSVFLKKGTLQKIPSAQKLISLIKMHSLVVGNGLTVHLQQSLFLFTLPSFATPIFISAYGFIDKLISSFRMLVNAYSAAVMPHAAGTHQEGFEKWIKLKKQQNVVLSTFCVLAGLVMFFFPDTLVTILLLGKNNQAPFFEEVVFLMKVISIVPLLIALNVLNVTELILEKKYTAYFIAGLFILLVSFTCIGAFKLGMPTKFAAYYPIVIEGTCLITYMVIVNKMLF